MRRYYNHNVNDRFFMVGDLVLNNKHKTNMMHKLYSPWEGPFIVKTVTQPGSLAMPCSSHTHTAPMPCVTVNRLARARDSAIHY